MEKKVSFVPKNENPANVPEARLIEDFWTIIKGLVYKGDGEGKHLDQLRNQIIYCFGKVDPDLVQRLAGSIKFRLDNIRRNDIIENRLIKFLKDP